MHVVCVGDVMVDVVALLPGPLAPGSDTPAAVTTHGGGAAANVACWLAVTGAAATFAGTVGDDAFGRLAVDLLEASDVAVSVRVDPSRPTGCCLVLVGPDGERTMVPDRGANDRPSGNALPDDATAVYVSGYALLGAGSRDAAVQVLHLARERGLPTVVDAASAAPLRADPGFLDRAAAAELLLANADEALALTGLAEPAAAAQALALRCGQAVVKRGAAGAVWSDGSGVWSVPAVVPTIPPGGPVDTTGAGDAFAAGFLPPWTAGAAPVEALRAGAALAARAVAVTGARPPVTGGRP